VSLCKTIGLQCSCQPDEGVPCPYETIEAVVKWGHGWRNAALKAQSDLAALSQEHTRQPDPATPQAAQAEPVAADVSEILSLVDRHAIHYAKSEYLSACLVRDRIRDLLAPAAPAQGGQPGDGAC